MENDEKTDETQVEEKEGQTEGVEETQTEGTEETVTPEAELANAKAEAAKYRRLFEKSQKPKVAAKASSSVSTQPDIEETVLLANGMPEELVAELRVVAGLRKTTLIKAQTDPIFVAVKDKFERDQKQKDASLPASRGSGGVQAQKAFNTPGLTREEHKKMVLDARG